MLSVFEDQWKMIMENGQMSETARITTADGRNLSISGIFFSGTYDIDKSTPYAAKTGVNQQFFQLSELSLADRSAAAGDLKLSTVQISRRGTFRTAIVKGEGSGMLTLYLQPVKG